VADATVDVNDPDFWKKVLHFVERSHYVLYGRADASCI